MSLELLVLRGVAAAGLLAAAWGYGVHWSNERHELKRLQAVEQARQVEANWQINVDAALEVKDDEIRRIAAARDAAIRELRSRSDQRMSPTANCSADGTGATGAQLSRPDAEAFARLAADADATAADLRACQTWVKVVTGAR